MAILKFVSFYLGIILLLVIYFCNPSAAAVFPNDVGRNHIRGPKLLASDTSKTANAKNANRVDPKRGCGEIGSRSECGQNSKCRWCRSDALDDMCFPKTEAWRLPSQVFVCEL